MTSTSAQPVRILIVDDHAVVRAGLRMLIESQRKFKVIGEAEDRKSALAVAASAQPDIVLLDVDLNGETSLDFLPELFTVAKDARVLILTGMRDPEVHHRAVRLGAMGLVFKEKTSEILLKAIEKVSAGEVWFDRSMMGNVLAEITRGGQPKSNPEAVKIALLTEREREIIALIGEGLKNKHIATRLFISETTVRHHLTSVFNKLEVTDRLELMIYAYRHGLAKPS